MELLQLKYFCSAAETENFTKTAKEHSVPASNISQIIHKLESELGTKLFDRTANRIRLNEKGKLFYEQIKPAIKLINEAKERLEESDKISGEIKILAETNRRLVTKAIEFFQESYPEVSFFINHSQDESPDKYDIIISDKVFPQKYFEKELLVVDEILLAMKKDNPLAMKKDLVVKDLENERFITFGHESGIVKLTHEICATAGFVPNIVIQSDDPHYIRKYVEMGLGICFYPSFSWEGTFSDGVVCRKIIDLKRYTYAYHNTQKYMPKKAELFMKTLVLRKDEII